MYNMFFCVYIAPDDTHEMADSNLSCCLGHGTTTEDAMDHGGAQGDPQAIHRLNADSC